MAAADFTPDSAMRNELRQARQRFVGTFARRCDELVHLARNGNGDGPHDELARAVHRLVGAAGLVGFLEVSKRASELEQLAKTAAAPVDTLLSRLETLREAYTRDEASPPDWAAQEDDLSRPAPLRLVLAEDDDLQRQTLTRFLEAAGHVVTGVARGDEVLAAVKAHKPAILILDIQLPGLDGYAICRQVKADPALTSVAVVFVTAAISTDDRLAGLLLGADDYVEKPVDLPELMKRLSAVAERRSKGELDPRRLAPGELSYPDFVARVGDMLPLMGGALVLLRMPADMGLPVATWLVGELRRDDLLARYRDDLRMLFLPGLRARTAERHVADIVGRLESAGLPVTSGFGVAERPGERSLATLLQEADSRLTLAPTPTVTPAAAQAQAPADVHPQRQRVLIADDDEMTRRLAERPLQRAGFECWTVEDGQYALDQMAQELPDVLVLDLSMPRVDGLQVLEEMRRRGGLRPYTIVISANRQEDDVRRALALGADDYVVKPFNPLTLLARVRRLLA